MENKEVIKKIWRNKGSNQLLITLPVKDFQEGEYVIIKKLGEE